MQDRVRVLRLIEYSGSREAVERQIERSMKDGTHDRLNCWPNGAPKPTKPDCVVIKIATLGDFPEILERAEIENDPRSLEQIMLEDGRKALDILAERALQELPAEQLSPNDY